MEANVGVSETNLYMGNRRRAKRKIKLVPLTLGPEEKKVLVKFPDINYLKSQILSHKLLSFNYVIGLYKERPSNYNLYQTLPIYNFEWLNKIKQIPRKYAKRPRKKTLPDNSWNRHKWRGTRTYAGDAETPEETLQRSKFAKRMRRDLCSSEVSEVILASRITATSREELQTSANAGILFQRRQNIYLETLRTAFNSHDWVLVSKVIDGLGDEMYRYQNCWIGWTGGFVATTNLFPNNLTKLKEYIDASKQFYTNYSPKIGIEFATWATQKGAFLEGYKFMQDEVESSMVLLPNKTSHYSNYHRNYYWKGNPKKMVFEFISILFEAVYHYSCYKKLYMNLTEDPESYDIKGELEHLGLTALNDFERLLQVTEELEVDVTIFIQPFIELVVQYRSKKEAKELLKEICIKNYLNGVLEEYYLNFLKKYFPSAKKEIKKKEMYFSRFQFEIKPEEVKYHTQVMRRYLEKKSVDNTQIPMKQIPNPSFRL